MSVNPELRAPLFLLAGRPRAVRGRNGADPLLQQAIRECAKAHPRIGYLGAASGDDRGFFKVISRWLSEAGAGDVLLAPTVGRNIDLGKTRDILESSDAVLVSGGDVEEGMRVMDERRLIPALRACYDRGTIFLGLSAGSIMLCRQWVRWRDPRDDSTAESFGCMGFAPIFCDTHGEAENWEELRALLRLETPGAIGYGIPSGAGLRVAPGGRLSALGEPVRRFVTRGGVVTELADLEPGAGGPGS